MIPVLSRAQMRAFDAQAIQVAKVPGLVLMENAGRGAAEQILPLIAVSSRSAVVIVCGTGNNGGDGFVVARHLRAKGRETRVFLCGAPGRLSPDARVNHDAFVGVGGVVQPLASEAHVVDLLAALADAGAAIDAIFGTGLDRPTEGLAARAISAMNAAPVRRFALDIPSGLDCDTGMSLGETFNAEKTFTFGHPKLGLLTPRGAARCGEVVVVGLGVPKSILPPLESSADLLERSDVAAWLSPRPVDAHKYSVGHVAVIAGSPGKIGASLLAAHGAMRAGAGAATIVTWAESAPAVEWRVLEVMCHRIDRQSIVSTLDAALKSKRSIVMGPGFGLDDDALAAVRHVLSSWSGPLVIDADALTLVARDLSMLSGSGSARVLTPHSGELARLLGVATAEVEADRFGAAQACADRTGSVVVLKGARTLISRPRGRMVINGNGNPALATAGSGDVLAGIVAALSCSLDIFSAACAGVFLHAEAGDRFRASHGDRGLLASEIADAVPRLIGELLAHADCPV